MYIFGFLPWLMISCCSLIETCLGVDRCLALIFPLKYNKSWKKWILLGAIIYLCLGAFGLITVSGIFKIFPKNPATNCRFFGCMFVVSSDKGTVTTNPVFAIPNILVGIILTILIHKKFRHKQGHLKSINKTAYLIIALTTCFELLPALFNEAVRIVTGTPPNLYLGPYGNTLMAVNFTICIYIYSKAFKKLKAAVMVQHTNISSNKIVPIVGTPANIYSKITKISRFNGKETF
uniref:Serpentine receptor class gamma n=1 Tax=Panagrolaimus sp. PS1159 TaxID=55785 RepID=A0AC35GVM5_9BILA